jgi:3,4-dihydroxy 2-butanone 4-phosphate synthase/GTP cyclohydrolase II
MDYFGDFVERFRRLRLGILIDDQGPTRAALISPAQEISASEVNRILLLSGGLTFVALSSERAQAFLLEPMMRPTLPIPHSKNAVAPLIKQFVSVEAREGVTTGISADDRATTLRILGHPTAQPRALVKPGHIFPVATHDGGVLAKATIAEGALDTVKEAGFVDAALFVDLLSSSGELASNDEARALANREGIPVATLSELISHRLLREPLVTRVAESRIPTALAGDVRALIYRSRIDDVEHIALVKGDISPESPVLVRVQSENTLSDVFGATPSSSRTLLHAALTAIGEHDCGVFLYLRRPHIEATTARERESTQPAQSSVLMREYGVGAQILRDLGVSKIELLTSTPRALVGLPSFGLTIISQRPIRVGSGGESTTSTGYQT